MAGRIARAHPRLLVLLAFTLLAFLWLVSHAPHASAQLAGPAGQAIADAQGGDGGDVRGGDGGRGGDGILGSCSSNVTDDEAGVLDCGLGGRGGDGGDAGESIGGNGGIAFGVGTAPQPTTPTPGLADLAVSKTAPANAGPCGLACDVRQVVTVTNIGAQTASNVTVVDNSSLVAQSGFIIIETPTPSQGTCSPVVANSTTCSLGDLAPGASATITLDYSLHIDVGPGILSDTATASTTSPEVTTANNAATAGTSAL